MRNKIGDWNTQATVSLIKSYDSIIGRFGNRYANGAYFQNGSQWGAQGIPNVGTAILWDNGGKDRQLADRPGGPKTVHGRIRLERDDRLHLLGGEAEQCRWRIEPLFDREQPVSLRPALCFRLSDDPGDSSASASLGRDLQPRPVLGHFHGEQIGAGNAPGGRPNSTVARQRYNQYGNPLLFLSKAPHKFLGYKDLDLQFTKNFSILPLG